MEELEEKKRLETEAKMKKEAQEKAELERQEAEETEMRKKRHEEWVSMIHDASVCLCKIRQFMDNQLTDPSTAVEGSKTTGCEGIDKNVL